MAHLNSALFITVLILACYFSFLDARNILKMEPQMVPSLKGTLPSLETTTSYPMSSTGMFFARFTNNERILQNSTPSPGAGHH
ncbi:hypothetical protein TanjilG_15284 [Lupinus angustifolius]|uniref:Uncharacterized protein n=1 Tax=Lupinus angustifolius TaxID=3871 RepID=A0A1J7HFJ2_LUPAN|nr:hypothetical protein TanjilG_15284 [Lupinus angustifolius]